MIVGLRKRQPVHKLELDPFDIASKRLEGRVRTAVAAMLEGLPRLITVGDLEAAVSASSRSQGAAAFDAARLPKLIAPISDAAFAAYSAAATDEASGGLVHVTKGEVSKADLHLGYEFDLTDPQAIGWAEKHSASLVVEIRNATRKTIRELIATALRDGGAPVKVARQIRPLIGLHTRWANAVLRYQFRLESDGMAASRVSSLTSKYYAKLLRVRSQTIARTEVLKAANSGKMAAWDQAWKAGYFGKTMPQKQWIAAADAEPICSAADGQQVDLYDEFSTSAGNFETPPAHPDCRCTAIIVYSGTPSDAILSLGGAAA